LSLTESISLPQGNSPRQSRSQIGLGLYLYFRCPRVNTINNVLRRRCFALAVPEKLGLLPGCSFFEGGCEETRLRLCGGDARRHDNTKHGVYLGDTLLMKCPNAEEVVHHFEEDCNVMTAQIPMSPKSTDDWVGTLLQIHSIPLMVSNAVQLLA
jgi:hypothetical protein